jgi:Ni/Co efflux regulator RcnB
MKRIGLIAAAIAAGTLATAGVANADNGRHEGWKKHHHHRIVHKKVVRHVVRRVPVRTRTVTRRVVVYQTGQYLPRDYYVNRTYYVQPTVYGLQPPPPGYEWVRVGNNVYLTQTNTGLISQVIANLIR